MKDLRLMPERYRTDRAPAIGVPPAEEENKRRLAKELAEAGFPHCWLVEDIQMFMCPLGLITRSEFTKFFGDDKRVLRVKALTVWPGADLYLNGDNVLNLVGGETHLGLGPLIVYLLLGTPQCVDSEWKCRHLFGWDGAERFYMWMRGFGAQIVPRWNDMFGREMDVASRARTHKSPWHSVCFLIHGFQQEAVDESRPVLADGCAVCADRAASADRHTWQTAGR